MKIKYGNQIIGIIYRATNLVNNKKYIGYTRKAFEYRKYQHEFNASTKTDIKACLKRNEQTKHFYNSIRMYGKENFKWDILCEIECITLEQLEFLKRVEKYFISYYKSNQPENGYNKTNGGDGVLHAGSKMEDVFGEEKANEIKQKIKNTLKNRQLTSEQKEKLLKKMRSKEYRKNFLKAMRDPERRRRISERQKGKKRTSQSVLKQVNSMKNRYIITDQMKKIIIDVFVVNDKSFDTTRRNLRRQCNRSLSKERFLEIIEPLCKEKNIVLSEQKKQYLKDLKNNTLPKIKTDPTTQNRIIQLADRGMSAHTISIQMKAEGIILNRGKIQRLIDAENIRRKNSNQPILKVNKSIKAPFVSNALITPQNIQNRPQ